MSKNSNSEKRIIAVFKNDVDRIPYLVHSDSENGLILGLELYPDIEQNKPVDKNDMEFLETWSSEYKEANKMIESLI